MLMRNILRRLTASTASRRAEASSRSDAGSPPRLIDPQHVRMFQLSHFFGPLIGLALAGFLAALGFPADYRMIGFAALVCLFWAYPAALARGADYRALSMLSLEHLTLTTLWASHAYGGLSSPFLLWLAVVPLLAFLYLAPDRRLWIFLIAMLAGNLALFGAASLLLPPPRALPETLSWLAAVSLLAAFAYVSMMAVYFSRVLSSRDEMALEAERRRANAALLDQRVSELRAIAAAKSSSLARMARECRRPLDEIVASSGMMLAVEAREQAGADLSDLRSIDEAAQHVGQVIQSIEAYAAAKVKS